MTALPEQNITKRTVAHICTVDNVKRYFTTEDEKTFSGFCAPISLNYEGKYNFKLMFTMAISSRRDDSSSNVVSISLNPMMGHWICDTQLTLQCSILNTTKEKIYTKSHIGTVNSTQSLTMHQFIEVTQLFNAKNGYLEENRMTFLVELEFDQLVTATISSKVDADAKEVSIEMSKNSVLQDLGEFLNSDKLEDITIKLDCGYKLKAHRAILAARSTIFKEMFKNFDEKEDLKIPKLSVSAGHELLQYIYTGKITDLAQFAQELLPIAKQYHLTPLTTMAKHQILSTQMLHLINFPLPCDTTQSRFIGYDYFSRKLQITDYMKKTKPSGKLVKKDWILSLATDSKYSNVQFRLTCYFSRADKRLGMTVKLTSESESFNLYVAVEYSVIDRNGKKQFKKRTFGKLPKTSETLADLAYRQCTWIKKDSLLDRVDHFLPDDTLTIQVEFAIYDIEEYECNEVMTEELMKRSESSALKNFETLLEDDDQNGDFILELESGMKLAAHKAILAARSQYFAAMLRHEVKEKKENRVVIEKLSMSIGTMLLQYLYTGRVDKLDKFAYQLVQFADMYQMDHLFNMCEHVLINQITEKNVTRLIGFADLHNLNRLKNICLQVRLCQGTNETVTNFGNDYEECLENNRIEN